MAVRNRFSLLTLFTGLLLSQIALGAGKPVTTLANPDVKYTVPKSGYHVLQRGDVKAVVVDNGAVDDETLKGHRAGYSGVASLTHKKRDENLFVPNYAGLNYEHIHDGTTQDRDILFEPRRAPMQLRLINPHTVELYQAPTPTWKLESVLRYEMLDDGTIEMTLECIPRAKTFRNGYIGLFWASYIHQPESLDIHFRGHQNSDRDKVSWVRGVTPSHGVLSTHVAASDKRTFKHDEKFPLTLAFNRSKHLYAEPWYYGVNHGLAMIQMFRPQDEIRLTQSPSGGGNGNPAWDFQFFIPDYKVGQLYQMVMRAQYVPFESQEQIQRVSRANRLAVGQSIAKDEREAAIRSLRKAGVQLTANDSSEVKGVLFSKRTATRTNLQQLSAIRQLETVRLFEADATDETVRLLRPIPHLKSLDLGFGKRLTDASTDEVVRHRELTFLNLGFCRQLTNSSFDRLSELPQLSILNLSVTSLTDEAMPLIGKIKSLTSLDIDRTRVTDAGLQHLLKLPKLRALRLVGIPMTDAGLLDLSTIRTLRHINLRDVAVSDEAIAEFRARLPRCVIKR